MTMTLSLSLVGFYSCSDSSSGGGGGGGTSSKVPKVKTCDYECGTNYAYMEGQIIEDWDMDIESFGVCWSKSGTPTVDDNVAYAWELYDENYFNVYTDNLDPNTTYYYRAFAENEKGIGYGEKKNFKTNSGVAEELFYDDGVCQGSVGLSNGGYFQWAVMFPASYITSSCQITKIKFYDMDNDESYKYGRIRIYTGGSSSPGTLQTTQDYYCEGSESFVEFNISNPVSIDGTQNVWIVFDNYYYGQYVASYSTDQGYANARWISTGDDWYDIGPNYNYITWMIRAYVTNDKGEEMPIERILDVEKMEADRNMNPMDGVNPENNLFKSIKRLH